jgi:hypothetical protein
VLIRLRVATARNQFGTSKATSAPTGQLFLTVSLRRHW